MRRIERRRCEERRARNFLRQRLRALPESIAAIGQFPRIQPQLAAADLVDIRLPVAHELPLQPQCAAEIIIPDFARRFTFRRFRLPIRFNRNAAVRRVRNRRCFRALLAHRDCVWRHRRFIRDADVRPAVRLPHHRLQVRHAPVQPTALEVQEPMLPLRRLDPRALMRAVRLAAALFEYDLGLIWAGNAPAAQAHLPPRRDAARGRKDVVPAVALVHLRPFNRRMLLRAVVEQVIIAERRSAVGRNRENPQPTLEPDSALGVPVDDVSAPVVIPEGTGVNQPLARLHQYRGVPIPQRIFRADHVDALVRHPVVDIKPPVLEADGGCPDALRMLRRGIPRFGDVLDGIVA